MRYGTNRTDYLLELVQTLRHYEDETDDSTFVKALLRVAANPERQDKRATSALYRPVDLVA